MKIKTLLYTTAAGLLTLASCDTVSENDRYIYVEEAEVQRCVLLEDFTGQQCPNCPNAAVETNKLQESYPNSVIAVAIHGGPLSPNTPVSLKSHVGDLYYSAAGQPKLPAGQIDRLGGTSVPEQWMGNVHTAIQRKAAVALSIENDYDADGNKAAIKIKAYGMNTASGKLQVWLVEDSIKAIQAMPDGSSNREYIHNHVLRAAVNGTWGEDISIAKGSEKTVTYTADLNPKTYMPNTRQTWNVANMHVVAFVYNDNGVQGVTKAALISNAENSH